MRENKTYLSVKVVSRDSREFGRDSCVWPQEELAVWSLVVMREVGCVRASGGMGGGGLEEVRGEVVVA